MKVLLALVAAGAVLFLSDDASAAPPIGDPHAEPPPIRVRLSASSPDVAYWLEPVDAERADLYCPRSCQLELLPGTYRLRAIPPQGLGLRHTTEKLELRQDSRIHVAPGSRVTHDWGVALAVPGVIITGLGVWFFAQSLFSETSEWEMMGSLGLVAVGGVLTIGGIGLQAAGRNHVTVDRAPLRREPAAALRFVSQF